MDKQIEEILCCKKCYKAEMGLCNKSAPPEGELDLIHRLQDENEAWRLKSKELEAAWEISSSNEEKLQKQVDELKIELNGYISDQGILLQTNNELQKQVDELQQIDPFPCKVGSGCESAGKGCYTCINNRYRQQAVKDTAKEILQEGKYCLSKSLRDWIKEHYGVEVE